VRVDNLKSKRRSWIWWYMPLIPALRKLTLGDGRFKGTLDYIARHSQKSKGDGLGAWLEWQSTCQVSLRL
jgi:hypothetical protein